MSIRALNWAWEQAPSSKTAKLVLVALADAANDDGGCFWGKRKLVAKCAPMTAEGIRRALSTLRSDGLIDTAQGRTDDGFYRTPTYTLLMEPSPGGTFAAPVKVPRGKSAAPSYIGEPSIEAPTGPPVQGRLDGAEEAPIERVSKPPKGHPLVAFYVEEMRRCGKGDPIGPVLGRLGRDVKRLARHVDEPVLRDALTLMAEKGLHVGALTGVVDQVRGGRSSTTALKEEFRGYW